MHIELRLLGSSYRLVATVFEGCDVTVDGDTTVVQADVEDEAAAFGLLDRARLVGLTVLSWRRHEQ